MSFCLIAKEFSPFQRRPDIEEFELELIDAGAEDIEVEDDFLSITTAMEDFGKMQKKLEEMEIEPESAELQRIPS
ncbi:MAG: YebC/PmpR family DNA-binding transcriptional regulator [Bacteroidales bacterium]